MKRQRPFTPKKIFLLVLIGCIAMTTYGQASAEDPTEGTEEPMVAKNDKEEIERQATIAKEERKREARRKKMTMESCLTQVRSFYSAQQAEIQEFIDAHPTLDKQRLMSKILSQMMIKCNGAINTE